MKLGTRPTIGIRLRARVSRPCSIFVFSDLTRRREKCVNMGLDPLGIASNRMAVQPSLQIIFRNQEGNFIKY